MHGAILQAPMSRRRPYALHVAATELGLAITVFGCGLLEGPVWLAGLASFALLAYWSWSRRRMLNCLRGRVWATQSALAVSVLVAVAAGAYWLGLGVKDMMG